MRPIRIYLDSSDFSFLSDPKRTTREGESTLKKLRLFISSGEVICCFSGIHLSEMAPVDAKFTDAAERRALLLEDLCGKNAVISQDRLFAAELRYAHKMSSEMIDVHSISGDWFPDGIAEISPIGAHAFEESINTVIAELGLSRRNRRLAERWAMKRGNPRSHIRAATVQRARLGNLDDVLDKYPMRPQDARVLMRYFAGDASKTDGENAFLNSLRDPRWMMSWFRQHHERMIPFIEWTRSPAAPIISSLETMTTLAEGLRKKDASLGTSLFKELFSSKQWADWQADLLSRAANRASDSLISTGLPRLSANTIDRMCPGISAGIRSLHNAWRTATTATPRRPKLSDFPDALHAIYSPYVDVFRADSFMAPYVQAQVERFGTIVVQRLSGLVPAIETCLSRKQ